MPDSIHPERVSRFPRVPPLAVAALVSGALVAGCGGSSSTPTTSASNGASATAHGAYGSGSLAFSRCMRANGVPGFPDPAPGRGFVFLPSGFNPNAPAVQAAQARCRQYVPSPSSSGGPAFSAQSYAQVLKAAQCMRQHGVSEFPDPKTTRPSFSPGIRVITDYDGAYLAFPATLNMQSPAYKQAAAACGSLAQKLGFGPHG